MEQILFVNACVRPGSRTLELARHVLSRLNGTVEEIDLSRTPVPPLDATGLARRDMLLATGQLDDPMLSHAAQFARADTIVIAAPYWDLMFPALLKAYLEAVTVSGVTFRYTESGRPATLCRAKRLIYVTTAGGFIGEYDFGFQYVSALGHGFYDIPDVRCYRAEGLDIADADIPSILSQVTKQIDADLS